MQSSNQKRLTVTATLAYRNRKLNVREWIQEFNPHESENITDIRSARKWLTRKIKAEGKYTKDYKRKVLWIEIRETPIFFRPPKYQRR